MENALLGSVHGLQPRMERFNAFIQAKWERYGVINVSRVIANLFFIQFSDEEGCENVMRDGPFNFDNHPIVLKKWHPRLSMDTVVCALPI